MQFKTKEILHLYYLQENATYGQVLANEGYNGNRVDHETTFKNFMGSYDLPLQDYTIHDSSYIIATTRFRGLSEFYLTQARLTRRALTEQLPFLDKVSAPPEELFQDYHGGPYLVNASMILDWANKQEAEHGVVHDIKPVDEIIPKDDEAVQRLYELQENFILYMTQQGFGPKNAM